jgi:hypothetical protein
MRFIDFIRGCPRKGARRGSRICGDRLFCGFGKDALVRIVESLMQDSVEPLLRQETETITPGQKS